MLLRGFVLLCCTFFVGCAGLAIDTLAKAISTTGTYSKLSKETPRPKEGSGRIYVYRTRESTRMGLTVGVGLLKNPAVITVDSNAYEVVWEAYRNFDVPAGTYEVTCGKDVIKSHNLISGQPYYRKGSTKLFVPVKAGQNVYVRLDILEGQGGYKLTNVPQSQAESEMANLPFQRRPHSYIDGKVE